MQGRRRKRKEVKRERKEKKNNEKRIKIDYTQEIERRDIEERKNEVAEQKGD